MEILDYRTLKIGILGSWGWDVGGFKLRFGVEGVGDFMRYRTGQNESLYDNKLGYIWD